jgi:2-dehydro-3-deoxyphosphooctonate aldolase (KDO 8-P synthase)
MKLCGFEVGLDQPIFLIAGTCVIESRQMAMDVAGTLKEITSALGIPFIYKSSFDKANRSSGTSFRGPGREKGLEILADVRKRTIGVPVLTDVHTEEEIPEVASIVDVLQTPAFLCRQTDFINACARSGKPVNIKKGQFLAPGRHEERDRQGARRGTRSRPERRQLHGLRTRRLVRLQQPGVGHAFARHHARIELPGGVRRDPLGAAAGRAGHVVGRPARTRAGAGARRGGGRHRRPVHGNPPGPGECLSDGPNAVPLGRMKELLTTLVDLDRVVKRSGFLENSFKI